MTHDERAKLRELLEQATPGGWNDQFEFQEGYAIAATTQAGEPFIVLTPNHNMPRWREDMALAIAAHNALPSILDELDSKGQEIKRLGDALSKAVGALKEATGETSDSGCYQCAFALDNENLDAFPCLCEECDVPGEACAECKWAGDVCGQCTRNGGHLAIKDNWSFGALEIWEE